MWKWLLEIHCHHQNLCGPDFSYPNEAINCPILGAAEANGHRTSQRNFRTLKSC
jgi:hypothetical protein